MSFIPRKSKENCHLQVFNKKNNGEDSEILEKPLQADVIKIKNSLKHTHTHTHTYTIK